MSATRSLLDPDVVTTRLLQAEVTAVHEDGAVSVVADGGGVFRCDLLQRGDASRLRLAAEDVVLVWYSSPVGERGVVLGRIGPSHAAPAETATAPQAHDNEMPDELVLEAKHSLTLRVGSGSITIREGGKILIKGKDLVSHAKGLNRIKGSAVQIN